MGGGLGLLRMSLAPEEQKERTAHAATLETRAQKRHATTSAEVSPGIKGQRRTRHPQREELPGHLAKGMGVGRGPPEMYYPSKNTYYLSGKRQYIGKCTHMHTLVTTEEGPTERVEGPGQTQEEILQEPQPGRGRKAARARLERGAQPKGLMRKKACTSGDRQGQARSPRSSWCALSEVSARSWEFPARNPPLPLEKTQSPHYSLQGTARSAPAPLISSPPLPSLTVLRSLGNLV